MNGKGAEGEIVASVFGAAGPTRPFVRPATLLQRLVNFLIDGAIYATVTMFLMVVPVLIVMVTDDPAHPEETELLLSAVFPLLFIFCYAAIRAMFEGITGGRSPGKYLTRTVAVRHNLTRLKWDDAFKRSFLRLLPFEMFSFLLPAQAFWHDSLSGTRVIRRE